MAGVATISRQIVLNRTRMKYPLNPLATIYFFFIFMR